jgi:hypothetical protein
MAMYSRFDWMRLSAPPDVRRVEYDTTLDKFGCYDLLGVGCRDWSDEDCPVWVYVQTGQFLRAHKAACDAEVAAARAEGRAAAAEAAYRLVRAAEDADAAAVERVAAAVRQIDAACEEAVQAALDAHHSARETHRYARDDDRASATADTACAAAERAAAARDAALAASQAAEAAALEAGVDPAVLAHACQQAAGDAYSRAMRDSAYYRDARAPRWRPTEYCAGRFNHDWYRALRAMQREYLGVER